MSESNQALVCRDVVRAYHLSGGEVPALRGVDLSLPGGSFTALIGPSGSGKSTLLRLLACVDRADAGAVVIDGTDVTRMSRGRRARMRRRRIGYLFQNPADNLLEYLTVRQHLDLGARLRGMSRPGPEVDAMLDRLRLRGANVDLPALLDPDAPGQPADELLARFEIGHLADRYPSLTSGGEQQRTALARAFRLRSPLLFADEPTGHQDRERIDLVLGLLREHAYAGNVVLISSHDEAVVTAADRVITLADGRLVADSRARSASR